MPAYRMYGLDVTSAFALPGLRGDAVAAGGERATEIRLGPAREAFSASAAATAQLTVAAGERITVERGDAGDLLLRYAGRADFHVSADGAVVTCAPRDRHALDWQRVLLDTVLGSAAIVHGLEALHAGAVRLPDGGVIAICGASGGGKSTLCAELLRRGAELFSDDMVFVSEDLLAHAGPPLMNLPPGALLGDPIAEFDGEVWAAVERSRGAEAEPLALVVMLERGGPGDAAELQAEHSGLILLGAALDTGSDPERRRRRFERLAELAQSTPIVRLRAGEAATPARLAELVERAAGRLAAA